MSLIASILRQHEPDVVARLEADSRAYVKVLNQELGMQVAFGEASTSGGHIAWLSRPPIHRTRNHRNPHLAKTLLELETTWEGKPLHLFATHLASRWGAPEPVDEIPIILDTLRRRADQPHLLVGDFNSLRSGDSAGLPPEGVEKRGDAVDGAPRAAIRLILNLSVIRRIDLALCWKFR